MLHANISNEGENDATYHQYIHSYQRMIMSAYEINMYLPCCLTHSTYSAIMLCIINMRRTIRSATNFFVSPQPTHHLDRGCGGMAQWSNAHLSLCVAHSVELMTTLRVHSLHGRQMVYP